MREDVRRLQSIEARLMHMNLPDVVIKSIPESLAIASRVHLQTSREAWPWVLSVAAAMKSAMGSGSLTGLALTMPDEGFETSDFTLQASLPVKERCAGLTADLFITTLPELPAAATVVQSGGPDLLHQGCAAIAGWVESHGYRIVGPSREVLLSSPLSKQCDELIIEAQFPVEPDGASSCFTEGAERPGKRRVTL